MILLFLNLFLHLLLYHQLFLFFLLFFLDELILKLLACFCASFLLFSVAEELLDLWVLKVSSAYLRGVVAGHAMRHGSHRIDAEVVGHGRDQTLLVVTVV